MDPVSRAGTVLLLALSVASCVLPPYRAQGKACDAEHLCPDGLACVSGVCGDCSSSADCAGAQVCTEGVCGACSETRACASGERCSAGACEATCEGTLQALVDAAPSGAVVVVPACTWREQLTLSKPVTLAGRPGAEVRGSAVWTGWTAGGGFFTGPSVPAFAAFGTCATGQPRCRMPEQVFFDGTALKQVAANPAKGEFALGANRAVVLADDPAGHVVEVSVRQRWVTTRSDGVTLRGLTFRHAAAGADGALSNDGRSEFTLERARLLDAHGPLVSLEGGARLVVQDSVLERAGQVALRVQGASEVTLARNAISQGNTEGFDPTEGPTGGVALSAAINVTVKENEVARSEGKGIACLQDCKDVTIEDNRVHHTAWNGIWYGTSERGTLRRNVVWECGWKGDTVWAWGGGILVWSASTVDVGDNLVAWCADGITVISQGQTPAAWKVHDVLVHDNRVFATVDPRETTLWMLALGWVEDWSGAMFTAASNNKGRDNRFFSDRAEDANRWPFTWNNTNGFSSLADFAKTPGGTGSAYLTFDEKTQLLTDAGVPTAPEAH